MSEKHKQLVEDLDLNELDCKKSLVYKYCHNCEFLNEAYEK